MKKNKLIEINLRISQEGANHSKEIRLEEFKIKESTALINWGISGEGANCSRKRDKAIENNEKENYSEEIGEFRKKRNRSKHTKEFP